MDVGVLFVQPHQSPLAAVAVSHEQILVRDAAGPERVPLHCLAQRLFETNLLADTEAMLPLSAKIPFVHAFRRRLDVLRVESPITGGYPSSKRSSTKARTRKWFQCGSDPRPFQYSRLGDGLAEAVRCRCCRYCLPLRPRRL